MKEISKEKLEKMDVAELICDDPRISDYEKFRNENREAYKRNVRMAKGEE